MIPLAGDRGGTRRARLLLHDQPALHSRLQAIEFVLLHALGKAIPVLVVTIFGGAPWWVNAVLFALARSNMPWGPPC